MQNIVDLSLRDSQAHDANRHIISASNDSARGAVASAEHNVLLAPAIKKDDDLVVDKHGDDDLVSHFFKSQEHIPFEIPEALLAACNRKFTGSLQDFHRSGVFEGALREVQPVKGYNSDFMDNYNSNLDLDLLNVNNSFRFDGSNTHRKFVSQAGCAATFEDYTATVLEVMFGTPQLYANNKMYKIESMKPLDDLVVRVDTDITQFKLQVIAYSDGLMEVERQEFTEQYLLPLFEKDLRGKTVLHIKPWMKNSWLVMLDLWNGLVKAGDWFKAHIMRTGEALNILEAKFYNLRHGLSNEIRSKCLAQKRKGRAPEAPLYKESRFGKMMGEVLPKSIAKKRESMEMDDDPAFFASFEDHIRKVLRIDTAQARATKQKNANANGNDHDTEQDPLPRSLAVHENLPEREKIVRLLAERDLKNYMEAKTFSSTADASLAKLCDWTTETIESIMLAITQYNGSLELTGNDSAYWIDPNTPIIHLVRNLHRKKADIAPKLLELVAHNDESRLKCIRAIEHKMKICYLDSLIDGIDSYESL